MYITLIITIKKSNACCFLFLSFNWFSTMVTMVTTLIIHNKQIQLTHVKMVALKIYSKCNKTKYKSTLCSKATFFIVITKAASILLPFIFAYKSRGNCYLHLFIYYNLFNKNNIIIVLLLRILAETRHILRATKY